MPNEVLLVCVVKTNLIGTLLVPTIEPVTNISQ